MKKLFFLLSAATTLLLGCDKSYEKFDPNGNSNSDTVWANNLMTTLAVNDLYQDLYLAPFTDSVSAQNGGTISFPNNIIVTAPASAFSFSQNGAPLTTGNVTIQIQLITKKGDMVRMCLPTQSNGYLLESGGEINITASKNGTLLYLALGKQITVSYRSAYAPNPLMKGFTGATPLSLTGPTSCFNWTNDDSKVKISTTTNGYQLTTNNLPWNSCGYFNDTASTKTTVAITMPLNFTNANTYTFMVYKNTVGVMQFDADATNKIWVKSKVPINKAVEFISISKIGGDYYFATYDTYTLANQHIVLKPSKVKMQDIIGYLETL